VSHPSKSRSHQDEYGLFGRPLSASNLLERIERQEPATKGRPTSQQAREGRKILKKEGRESVKASKRKGEDGRANRWSKRKRKGRRNSSGQQ